jgi:arginine decarboxylase
VTDDGQMELENFVRGQKARRLIESMGYSAPQLSASARDAVQDAIKRGVLGPAEGDSFIEHYDEELVGYTYLE